MDFKTTVLVGLLTVRFIFEERVGRDIVESGWKAPGTMWEKAKERRALNLATIAAAIWAAT